MDMNTYMYLLTLVRLSSLVSTANGVVLLVNRRLTGDTYALTENNSSVISCRENNTSTLLVSERRCIRNEELFNDCSFAIALSKEPSSYRLTLSIDHPKFNDTQIITAATFTSPNNTESAVIITKQMNQTISNHCQIVSLEVYRGKKHSTVINHCGFSLSDMGEVEINHTRLRYSFEEYLGELYRMNLSCSDGGQGLPESGCLFFKIGGTANITKSKFDSAIEESVESKESLTTLPVTSTTNQMTSPSTTNSTTLHSDPTATTTEVDILNVSRFGSNILVVVPLVGGGTILTFSIVMVCVAVRFKNRRKRKLNSISSQPQNQDTAATLEPNTCQRNPAYIQLGPVDGSQADLLSGSYSENPAYNIDAKTSSHQEPTYEVIPLDIDRTPHPVQGTQNINYNQNPAYIHVSVLVEESLQANPTAPSDYNQNPAYGIHSNPN